jgi:YggT family protein
MRPAAATCWRAARDGSFRRVQTFLLWFAYAIQLLGYAFAVVAAAVAIVALVDWLVRTRKINPFNPVARFFRRVVDPLIAPMERRVVRAGGMPHAAPWWTLVVAVVGGIVVLGLLRFIQGQLAIAYLSSTTGRGLVFLLLHYTFALLRAALIVRVISSWFRISPYSIWVRWSFVLSEPILRPLRGVIPPLGMIDVTPIIAYFALGIVEFFVRATLGG